MEIFVKFLMLPQTGLIFGQFIKTNVGVHTLVQIIIHNKL